MIIQQPVFLITPNFTIVPTSYFYHCIPYAPKAEYRFDECDEYNGTVSEVKDSSVNLLDGVGSHTTHTQSGKINKAVNFSANATNDFIELPPSAMDGLEDFTISVWIQSHATSDQAVISGANSSQHNELLMFITSSGGTISPYIKGSNSTLTMPYDVTDGTWHHLAWRHDGSLGKNCITIDGNSTVCANGASGNLAIQGLIVGQEQDSVKGGYEIGQDFEGLMDEFKIYDKYLSDDEVKNIYKNETKALNFDGTYRQKPVCVPLTQCYADSFDGGTLGDKWTIINKIGYTPKVVNNKLFLTELTGSTATGVTLKGEFPSADNYIEILFEHNAYGGSGADGMTIALADASIVNPLIDANSTTIAGAYGGSLGYAQRTGVDGFKGGWLGFGFDEYGNFSNATEGRIGGVGFVVDSISVRGKGSGQSGYEYITGTKTLNPQVDNNPNGYLYKLSIDTRNARTLIKVDRDIKDANGYQTVIDWFDATQTAISPEQFKFSLTGSTGGATNYHSIDGLLIRAASCGTLGQDKNVTSGLFDAWEITGTKDMRAIKTKVVEQDFTLTIAALNNQNNALQDFNGTVCARIVDSNNRSLSAWNKLLFAQTSEKSATFKSSYASKNNKIALKWKKKSR